MVVEFLVHMEQMQLVVVVVLGATQVMQVVQVALALQV